MVRLPIGPFRKHLKMTKSKNMVTYLKKQDRILLEMNTGILLFGLVCEAIGACFVKSQGRFAVSLWFGIALAVVGTIHMAHTLDRALVSGEKAAKIITAGYITRYVIVASFFVAISISGVLNPLVMFLGYMSLKVTAYLQPLTHKFYNFLFHETDPVAEPLPENYPMEEIDTTGEKLSDYLQKNRKKRR